MGGTKHDKGKPAFHLIDERFDREVIDDLGVSEDPGHLWDWARGGDALGLEKAFEACVNWLNTDNPKRTARLELARVLQYGAEAYGVNNWRKGFKWSRLWRAAYGHIESHWSGDLYDAESGILHLSHAMSNLMFLIVHERDDLGEDDRAEIWPQVKSSDQPNVVRRWAHDATGQVFHRLESTSIFYDFALGGGEKTYIHGISGRKFPVLQNDYMHIDSTTPAALKDADFVNQIRRDIWPDSQSET